MQRNEKEKLEILREQVRQTGIDIAPDYMSYVSLAFGLATELGEEGRELFHDLCRPCPKYDRENAEKTFTSAVQKGRGDVTLGTVFFHAKRWGIDVEQIFRQRREQQRQQAMARQGAPLQGAGDHSGSPLQGDDVEDYIAELEREPLPTFEDYDWPWPLSQIVGAGETMEQRDVLLLTGVAALGATLARYVETRYGGKSHYPCLQLFVVAPAASGKGCMSFVRHLLEPFHDELRRMVADRMAEYKRQMERYKAAGEKRRDMEMPVEPKNAMFIISGNNTGTGILQNLMDSADQGIIFETEADTVSAAIKGDYGHWSDTLRKVFDHERLSYNRRTNGEYRESGPTRLTVVLSGTPMQVGALIPSVENGLFSRQVFYYMPRVKEWRSQFAEAEGESTDELFLRLGVEWSRWWGARVGDTVRRLVLTPAQRQRFDSHFSSLLGQRGNEGGSDAMHSTVLRLGVNSLRIMEVVAFLRSPEPDAEGLIGISDDDFGAVLGLTPVLLAHAERVLVFLPKGGKEAAIKSVKQRELLGSLPAEFTREEYVEKAKAQGIGKNTRNTWFNRWIKRGVIEETGDSKYKKR